MNSIKLKHLLESLDEAHQQGEWWIDNMGEVKPYKKDGYYADDNLMQDDKWKRMKASKEKIEIFTHDFGAEDLRLIIKGIEKIMGVENTADDPDDCRLVDEHAHYLLFLGADAAHDADLLDPLVHGHHHDVKDRDSSDNHRDRANGRDEGCDRTKGGIDG